MLVRLLYASRAAEALTPEIVDSILAASRKGNPALGITGLLCYSGDIFMQVLEGGQIGRASCRERVFRAV